MTTIWIPFALIRDLFVQVNYVVAIWTFYKHLLPFSMFSNEVLEIVDLNSKFFAKTILWLQPVAFLAWIPGLRGAKHKI